MPVRQLTCRYNLHDLPLCPCSLKSSNVSEEAGLLLDRDTSPSVSEVLGLGCVKPVMFTLPLDSSIMTPAVNASLKCKVVQIGPHACQGHGGKMLAFHGAATIVSAQVVLDLIKVPTSPYLIKRGKKNRSC